MDSSPLATVGHSSSHSSDCSTLLGHSTASFPYFRDWNFKFNADLKPKKDLRVRRFLLSDLEVYIFLLVWSVEFVNLSRLVRSTYLFSLLFGNKEARILVLSALTMLEKPQFFMGEVVSTIPTIGFNVETVQYNNIKFQVWDIGKDTVTEFNWSFAGVIILGLVVAGVAGYALYKYMILCCSDLLSGDFLSITTGGRD